MAKQVFKNYQEQQAVGFYGIRNIDPEECDREVIDLLFNESPVDNNDHKNKDLRDGSKEV